MWANRINPSNDDTKSLVGILRLIEVKKILAVFLKVVGLGLIFFKCRPSCCDVNCMVTGLEKMSFWARVLLPFLLWKIARYNIILCLLLLLNSDILKQQKSQWT